MEEVQLRTGAPEQLEFTAQIPRGERVLQEAGLRDLHKFPLAYSVLISTYMKEITEGVETWPTAYFRNKVY